MNQNSSDRLILLDFLRGFALIGILISNIPIFAEPMFGLSPFQDLMSYAVKGFYYFFVTGKFFVLFSFVFGYGFSILLSSLEKKGKDISRVYFRRLFGLFFLGVLHALFLFVGDILVTYSLLGVLLFFRKDKPESWKNWIIGFWILSYVCYTAIGVASYYSQEAGLELSKKLTQESITNRLGTVIQILTQQFSDLTFSFPFILLFNAPTATMMFLVGLWAGRNQKLSQPEKIWESAKGKKRYLLVLAVVTNGFYTYGNLYPNSIWSAFLFSGMLAFGGISLAFLYVLTIIRLLFLRNKQPAFLMTLVTNAGSMSLTNYLMQSLLCSLIFNGWGLGMFSKLSPLVVIALVPLIYGFNLLFSFFWKKFFEMGPMEMLLRKWTYS